MLLSLTTVASIAQQQVDTRPKLFADKPQTISLDKNILANAIASTEGSTVTLQLSNDFTFTGTVFSNQVKYNNLQTMMIRSSENSNSIFQISKITNEDNTISYVGRLLNKDAADGYQLKNNNENYSLQKFEALKLLEPCKSL
jgi:hypothetical protein